MKKKRPSKNNTMVNNIFNKNKKICILRAEFSPKNKQKKRDIDVVPGATFIQTNWHNNCIGLCWEKLIWWKCQFHWITQILERKQPNWNLHWCMSEVHEATCASFRLTVRIMSAHLISMQSNVSEIGLNNNDNDRWLIFNHIVGERAANQCRNSMNFNFSILQCFVRHGMWWHNRPLMRWAEH